MSLRLPLRFEGNAGEKTLYALFDSGATYSCINSEIAEVVSEYYEMVKAQLKPVEIHPLELEPKLKYATTKPERRISLR